MLVQRPLTTEFLTDIGLRCTVSTRGECAGCNGAKGTIIQVATSSQNTQKIITVEFDQRRPCHFEDMRQNDTSGWSRTACWFWEDDVVAL
jgi:hypothetical protein